MPARSPLTAAARQCSRRPARHVVCPLAVNWGQTLINFVMHSRHAGSVAAHRRCAATLASARPACRLSDRHISSDSIFAVVEMPLQPIKSLKAEQARAFFRAKAEKKSAPDGAA